MKKLILFSLLAIFLMSCGGAGTLPTDNITVGQAFNHVSQYFSYWVWIIPASILLTVGVFLIIKRYRDCEINGWQVAMYFFITLTINLCVWLIRPCDVAANTTVEQAARGVFIGF